MYIRALSLALFALTATAEDEHCAVCTNEEFLDCGWFNCDICKAHIPGSCHEDPSGEECARLRCDVCDRECKKVKGEYLYKFCEKAGCDDVSIMPVPDVTVEPPIYETTAEPPFDCMYCMDDHNCHAMGCHDICDMEGCNGGMPGFDPTMQDWCENELGCPYEPGPDDCDTCFLSGNCQEFCPEECERNQCVGYHPDTRDEEYCQEIGCDYLPQIDCSRCDWEGTCGDYPECAYVCDDNQCNGQDYYDSYRDRECYDIGCPYTYKDYDCSVCIDYYNCGDLGCDDVCDAEGCSYSYYATDYYKQRDCEDIGCPFYPAEPDCDAEGCNGSDYYDPDNEWNCQELGCPYTYRPDCQQEGCIEFDYYDDKDEEYCLSIGCEYIPLQYDCEREGCIEFDYYDEKDEEYCQSIDCEYRPLERDCEFEGCTNPEYYSEMDAEYCQEIGCQYNAPDPSQDVGPNGEDCYGFGFSYGYGQCEDAGYTDCIYQCQ